MISDHSLSRRAFLKTAAAAAFAAPFVTRGLLAQSPNSILRHASFGAGGMAWADLAEIAKCKGVQLVAVAEVDLARTAELKKRFPETRIYQDWRKLLDKEAKNIDSVNVSTPDHMHAPIAMSAMHLGKHVYCQKPLTHDLYEARKLREFARKQRLVTQMGIQIHSMSYYRLATQLIQSGVIGKVKEVHLWCGTNWSDSSKIPDRVDKVPEGLDWDLWLGVCAQRPFIGPHYYHPSEWRRRLDFGTGSLGDMGCHIFDTVFRALRLTAPVSVRSEGPAPNQWNWAPDSCIQYLFPGTAYTAEKSLKATWYDASRRPPAEVKALLEGDDYPGAGSLFIGTEGHMVLPHINRPQLYPDKKYADFKFPEVTSLNHWGSFVEACKGEGCTSANFDYAGPLAEAVLVGTVASHFPQTTLLWNAEKLRFDEREANRFVRRDYRKGWSVKGLS